MFCLSYGCKTRLSCFEFTFVREAEIVLFVLCMCAAGGVVLQRVGAQGRAIHRYPIAPPPPTPPLSPTRISRTVSVDVKHYDYLLLKVNMVLKVHRNHEAY